ncbi:organic hydroperoxide resistance protein [Patulibacter sp.]|uniref:organic hydroperoxide resistance protein n=1 Tax=Patulibacter sp. TaxID=1912859 RepID=UPI00271AF15B|nr:organic hydroperoxide resistance protein [Patulibacter sp.]MDO9409597.1 organic hydroperoxide resistance protein [Patulibacter sp.]
MAGFKPVYAAKATVTGGRDGSGKTDDGRLDVQLDKPAALGGPDESTGTNPEQLFAVGWAACFEGAVAGVAGDTDVSGVSIDATVEIGKAAGGLGLQATLDVTLPGVDDETAVKIVHDAHQVCPYSRATRGNVPTTLTANGQPVEA